MSHQYRVLVVGGGSIGERHVRCFLQTGRAQVALCELNDARREFVATTYPLAASYGDWTAALDSRPDVVVVATPAHLHLAMARDAILRGAAVLIEKPLATTDEGVSELQQVAIAAQRPVSVAYVYRSHPALGAMREALHSGRFGRPLQLVSVSGQNFPFYRPAYRETYYTRHATGGGAVQDALTHHLNAAEWLVGPIDRVCADIAHLALPGVDVEDTAHVIARQGPVCSLFCLNQHQAPNESSITVICERGTARFEYHQHRWRWMTEPAGAWHDEPIPTLERDTLFIAQAQRFLDTVDGTLPPACTLAEAWQTLQVNRAILDSAAQQSWVTLETITA